MHYNIIFYIQLECVTLYDLDVVLDSLEGPFQLYDYSELQGNRPASWGQSEWQCCEAEKMETSLYLILGHSLNPERENSQSTQCHLGGKVLCNPCLYHTCRYSTF